MGLPDKETVMECYLDNSATTRCYDEVAATVLEVMTKAYGNPSSMHDKGVEAEKYIRSAKEVIAKSLKCQTREIYFTSGGTESDNWAIVGAALAHQRRGRHLITTSVEHPAVIETMKSLEKQGFSVTYLPVNERGEIRICDLEQALTPDTILVSIMHTNNEVGSCMPLEEAGRLIKSKCPECLFHVDAVQGYGKIAINPKKLGIDLMSVSAHKIHGPKGIGFLYIADHARILPILYGGGQQGAMRSGTENVPGIAGLGKAVEILFDGFEEKMQRVRANKDALIHKLETLEDVVINGPGADIGSAPHIVSLSVSGIRAEVLLHALEGKGIYVSSGSACASNKPAISETLKGIGVARELLDSTIRISLSEMNTEEEMNAVFEALKELLPALRRFTRR